MLTSRLRSCVLRSRKKSSRRNILQLSLWKTLHRIKLKRRLTFGNQEVPSHPIKINSDPNLELGRMLLFTHGIDLAKDIARNCGVTASIDWVANTVTMTSQDVDLIAQAVQRFNKLEEFYVVPSKTV
jgi:hypothetical protein